MGIVSKLKEVFGLDTREPRRRRDVSVSVERRDSPSASELSEGPESVQEKEGRDEASSGQPEVDSEDEHEVEDESETPVKANSDPPRNQDTMEEDGPDRRSTEDSGHSGSASKISVQSSEFAELTGFKRDLLILIGGMETPKGTEIMEELEGYYDENVNHGRLYPNLDDLVDDGYVEKISLNARSNGYNLTDKGTALLENRQRWVKQMAGPLNEMNAQPDRQETGKFIFEHEQTQTSTEDQKETGDGGETANSSDDRSDDSKLVDDIMDGFDDLGEQVDD